MSGLVLVTGASRGIGAATAVLAAAHGYKVAVNYVRDEASAANVCTQIEQGGGSAFALQGDVAREEDVLRLFERIDAADEPLTGMVNNVGVVGYAAPSRITLRSACSALSTPISSAPFWLRGRRSSACRRSTAVGVALSSTFPPSPRASAHPTSLSIMPLRRGRSTP